MGFDAQIQMALGTRKTRVARMSVKYIDNIRKLLNFKKFYYLNTF